MLSADIQRRIEESQRVCVFTGAGVSAESGIPTFRSAGGLWDNYRPEDLATPGAFARDPVMVWQWYAWRQELVCSAEPNAAHKTIVAMDEAYAEFLLVTQNVDDLHERAGTKRMVKVHGSIMEMRCLDVGHIMPLKAPLDKDSITRESLPTCPTCASVCRPNVVWFGEMLPPEPVFAGREFAAACDMLLIVGTSGVVGGGYGLAELARLASALVVEVNPEESALTHLADISVREPAAEVLPRIFHKPLTV